MNLFLKGFPFLFLAVSPLPSDSMLMEVPALRLLLVSGLNAIGAAKWALHFPCSSSLSKGILEQPASPVQLLEHDYKWGDQMTVLLLIPYFLSFFITTVPGEDRFFLSWTHRGYSPRTIHFPLIFLETSISFVSSDSLRT